MSYYDLTKEERKVIKQKINDLILSDIRNGETKNTHKYSSDDDTYIRKNVYLAIGKLYKDTKKQRNGIHNLLRSLYQSKDEKVRQTAIYALGEIGKIEFDSIQELLVQALSDSHHSVLNAVTGTLKQLGERKPIPTIAFVSAQLEYVNSQVRVKLLHGLELRGRTHPDDVLPILTKYQNDPEKKVKDTIIHILGQISYKKGCLKQVINNLKEWKNIKLVRKALEEIVIVHQNYRKFSFLSPEEALELIRKEFDIA